MQGNRWSQSGWHGSNEATVTIVKPLEITSQPKSVSGQVGTPISMSVTASGENLSYQWEYYDVNSGKLERLCWTN